MGDYSRFRTRNGSIDLTRLKYLKHIIKYKVIVAAAIYLFLCSIFFPSLRYMMGPDGLNYIAIAELYAAGQWAAAINAYWSPAFSILLAPFVAIGFDGIMAIKLLNILIGFAVLFALAWLCNTLHLKSSVLAILLISAVPFIASSAFLNATPDLLVVLVLTTYLTCLLRVQKFNQIKMSWKEEEDWHNYYEKINQLIERLHDATDAVMEDDDFGTKELDVVQGQMKNLIEQGEFWIKNNNAKRFIYDLEQHIKWLVNYIENIIDLKYGEQSNNNEDEF